MRKIGRDQAGHAGAPRKESGRNLEFDNDSDNDIDFDFDFDTTAMNHMVKAFSMSLSKST